MENIKESNIILIHNEILSIKLTIKIALRETIIVK